MLAQGIRYAIEHPSFTALDGVVNRVLEGNTSCNPIALVAATAAAFQLDGRVPSNFPDDILLQ